MSYWNDTRRIGTPGVETTNATVFDGEAKYFVIVPGTRRTFCETQEDAASHADNLLDYNRTQEEYLVVKVVGRVSRKKIPHVRKWFR